MRKLQTILFLSLTSLALAVFLLMFSNDFFVQNVDNNKAAKNSLIDNPINPSFLSGFKIENLEGTDEKSEANFALAKQSDLDYIGVPVVMLKNSKGEYVWSGDSKKIMNYYTIFELANKYDISVIPAFFYKDPDPDGYANFINAFLEEFYPKRKIKYVELQNEPVKDYDGVKSARFGGTPADLAKTNIAAYEAIKGRYPDISVGSPGFIASSVIDQEENSMMNEYYKEYFSAKPKFDFLVLHFYLRSSNYLQNVNMPTSGYNFMNEYDTFRTYGKLLNDYGYNDKPILVTEGDAGAPLRTSDGGTDFNTVDDNEYATVLAEMFSLGLSQKEETNLMGLFISTLESGASTALRFDKTSDSFIVSKRWEFYALLSAFIDKYPDYLKHVAGKVNADDYWIEEFENDEGGKMWLAFCPLMMTFDAELSRKGGMAAIVTDKSTRCPQDIVLEVGDVSSVKITTVSGEKIMRTTDKKINFELTKEPVFIEEIN